MPAIKAHIFNNYPYSLLRFVDVVDTHPNRDYLSMRLVGIFNLFSHLAITDEL